MGKEEHCDAACQQLWVNISCLASLGKVHSLLLRSALGSPLHHRQIYFRCNTQGVKGQARRKVDVTIYRAALTSTFGVGFFVVILDPYSAAAEGGVLCACEVVQSGKLCHGTAFREQLFL